MARKNKVEIQIKAEADKASRELKKFSKDTARGFRDVKRESKSLSDSMGKLKRAVAVVAAAFAALKGLQGVVNFLKSAGRAAEEEEWALRGLHAVIISMKRDTEGFEQSMIDLASAMQKLTGYADDQILTAIKFLSTYREITNDVMPRALKLTLDIARGWGVELRSAANMVGKAAMGMTGELRRYGITVDQNVYKSRGFLGVMEQIEAQVAGQAKAYRETTTGLKEYVAAVWGDVKEQFGYIINEVLDPFRKAVGDVLSGLSDKLQEWREGVDLREWAADTAQSFKEFATRLADELIPALGDLIPKIEDVLKKTSDTFSFLERNFNRIKTVIQTAIEVIKAPGPAVFMGKDWVENSRKIEKAIIGTKETIEEPTKPQVDITEAKKSTEELHAEWERIKRDMESRPIKVRIVKETIYTGGGAEYEYGRRRGGLIRKQRGGLLPGYGGGDIVHLVGEPGEFMLRKEATRSIMNAFGSDFLNRMNREGARALDYMVLDLRMGDRSYPITVEKGDAVDRLMQDVKSQEMTRG